MLRVRFEIGLRLALEGINATVSDLCNNPTGYTKSEIIVDTVSKQINNI